MRRFLALGFLIALACASVALAAPKFPQLTGRVVDEAHVLSPGIRDRLTQKLADHEAATTNQVVVVTLKSLDGMEIQDYGYQLGRAWGIGQKGKNNGVILLVAPNDRKVGIEVGYGLEGTLTDAATGVIINDTILPEFKAGRISSGIWNGTEAILATLGGNGAPPPVAHGSGSELSPAEIIILLIFLAVLVFRYPTFAWFLFTNLPSGSYRGGGGGVGGFSSGGGFSGGGGSFGGGGSSGSW